MSSSLTFGTITDGSLTFSNISVVETGVGDFNSVLADVNAANPSLGFAPRPIPSPSITGLNWSGFVGGATGPGSSLSLVIEYDITSSDPTLAITSVFRNSFTPDTQVPVGSRLLLRQEVFSGTDLVGVSQLERSPTATDTADPPFEMPSDMPLSGAFAAVRVKITIEVSIAETAAPGTSTSFSIMQQAFNAALLPASLGDYVFEDNNFNGIQDAGDTGIAGVTVHLLDQDGNATGQTDVTDANGRYDFTGLAPGQYSVRFETPAGYERTLEDVGDDALDSDIDAAGVSDAVTLGFGENNPTLDAGFFRRASLGDFVFWDRNENGIQDAGDEALEGVIVNLLDANGSFITSTSTTDTGFYAFLDLLPGQYQVQFITPSGFAPTASDQGGDDALDSDANVGNGRSPVVTLSSGEHDDSLDAGFVKPVVQPSAELGNRVWLDLDADGFQDFNENGIANIRVDLLDATGSTVLRTEFTDGSGEYLFSGLEAGSYRVRFDTTGFRQSPVDQADDALDSDAGAGGLTGIYTLADGEQNLTVDAGLYLPVSIGDRVWLDRNANGVQDGGLEVGIQGVKVELLDANGDVVDFQFTNLTGNYLFTDLDPGTYRVRFDTTGFEQSPADVGNDALDSDAGAGGETGPYTLLSGQTDLTVDAGLYRLAGLGDFVWLDTNGNGLQDDGATGLGGVTVRLLDAAGNPTGASTTTAADGSYSFTGLVPGSYGVQFVAPSGYAFTTQDAGADTNDSDANPGSGIAQNVTLLSGQFDGTLDAGLVRLTPKIEVVKTTSGNANVVGTDGITLLAGSNVFWTYAVTNNGPVDLTDIVLTDDVEGLIANLVSGDDGDQVLEVGETWIYQAQDADAVLGPYANLATVTGRFTDGLGTTTDVQDSDPSNYVGVRPDVDIEKLVSVDGGATFVDADDPAGPLLLEGTNQPIFRFVVTNTGTVALTDLVVDDDKLDLNGAAAGDTVTIASLAVGDSIAFTVTGAWQAGQHVNTATVAGTFTDDWGNSADVGDSDKAHYVGQSAQRSLDIEKTTDGSSNGNAVDSDYDNEDAANGAGVPVLTVGSDVTWTYRVTNDGQASFAAAEIAIVDDNGTPGSAADDMSIANGKIVRIADEIGNNDDLLEAGEVWLYQASGVVQALGGAGAPVTIVMEGSSPLSGAAGNMREFSAGGVAVKASAFSRDTAGGWADAYLGAFGGGLGVTDGAEGSGSGNAHTVDNTGRDNYVLFAFNQQVVVDAAFLGYVVHDSDLRLWIGTLPDAFTADIALSDALLAGLGFTEVNETTLGTARWADFNAGNVAGNVLVIAANTGEATTEDNFKIEKLKVAPVGEGIYKNIATVSAPDTPGDSDASHYRSVAPPPPKPGLDIEKTTNGPSNANNVAPTYDNEDAANGAGVPLLTAGSSVTWTYRVENTGNTTFAASEIVLVDDNGTAATGDDMSLANGRITRIADELGDNDNLLEAGEVWLYQAGGIVKDLTTPGAAVSFDFSGNSALDGTNGNIRSWTAGDVSVKASAFSRTEGGSWATAWLGAYGGGLGVTDRGEGDGRGDRHTVDNWDRDNYVLFRFDQKVVVDKAFLGYVVCDSDISVWIGTIDNAFNTTVTLTDSVLNGLGFTEVNNTTLSSARWADFNNGNLAGNVLVIAASVEDHTPDDYFKIEKLDVAKAATSGVYSNKATVSAQGVSDSDLSHYRNGTTATPGIDLEKTTNGPSNRNHVTPGWDNEDMPDGAGVPILTPGSGVTWTYKLFNSGETKIAAADIRLFDDNGTMGTADDMSIANGKITLTTRQGGNQDNILDPGETWFYEAKGTVQNLVDWGSATTFDFSGSSALSGTHGNVRTYTVGDISVKASAFSEVNGHWQSAYLGAFGSGLGVTDRNEGDGGGDRHTVDNIGRENFVVFRFNQDVVVDKAFLGYVVGDSDISVWIGNVANAFNTSFSLNASVLSSLGFTEVNNTSSGSARWADINAGDLSGNVLVVAASLADTTPDDRFKLEKLVVYKEPEVGFYENTATAWVPGASDSDVSHYTNPDVWH
jgi:hypothetical protein